MRWFRAAARKRTLGVLSDMQPASGGFLEATPLTSFVVMSLASIGLEEHPVVRRGIELLLMNFMKFTVIQSIFMSKTFFPILGRTIDGALLEHRLLVMIRCFE